MLWLKCFCIVDEIVILNNLHACVTVTTMSMTDILKREAEKNRNIGSLESFQNSLNWKKKSPVTVFLVRYARTKIIKLANQWHGKYNKESFMWKWGWSTDTAVFFHRYWKTNDLIMIWLEQCKSPWSQDSAWWVYKRLLILKFPIWILWNTPVSSYKWPSTMIKGFSFQLEYMKEKFDRSCNTGTIYHFV